MKRRSLLARMATAAVLASGALSVPAVMAQQTCDSSSGKPLKASLSFSEVTSAEVSCPAPTPSGSMPGLALSGSGHASHLGRVQLTASNCAYRDPNPNNPDGLIFTGPGGTSPSVIIEAANGDKLFARFSGTATPLAVSMQGGQYILNGSYTIAGGTGRFENATGCGVLSGMEDVHFTGSGVSGEGGIQLQGVLSY